MSKKLVSKIISLGLPVTTILLAVFIINIGLHLDYYDDPTDRKYWFARSGAFIVALSILMAYLHVTSYFDKTKENMNQLIEKYAEEAYDDSAKKWLNASEIRDELVEKLKQDARATTHHAVDQSQKFLRYIEFPLAIIGTLIWALGDLFVDIAF